MTLLSIPRQDRQNSPGEPCWCEWASFLSVQSEEAIHMAPAFPAPLQLTLFCRNFIPPLLTSPLLCQMPGDRAHQQLSLGLSSHPLHLTLRVNSQFINPTSTYGALPGASYCPRCLAQSCEWHKQSQFLPVWSWHPPGKMLISPVLTPLIFITASQSRFLYCSRFPREKMEARRN